VDITRDVIKLTLDLGWPFRITSTNSVEGWILSDSELPPAGIAMAPYNVEAMSTWPYRDISSSLSANMSSAMERKEAASDAAAAARRSAEVRALCISTRASDAAEEARLSASAAAARALGPSRKRAKHHRAALSSRDEVWQTCCITRRTSPCYLLLAQV
jgi:hypothetical protein